jgi:hypothetical protein
MIGTYLKYLFFPQKKKSKLVQPVMEERDEGHVAEEVDVVTYAVAASSGGLVQRAETGSSEHQDDNGGSVLRLCVVRESAAGVVCSIPPSLPALCVRL